MPRTLTERMIWRNKDGVFTGTATKNFGDLGNVWITVRQAGADITVEVKSHTHPALDKPPVPATDMSDVERIVRAYIDSIDTLRREISPTVFLKARKLFDEIVDTALDKRLHPEKYPTTDHWPSVNEIIARRAERTSQ